MGFKKQKHFPDDSNMQPKLGTLGYWVQQESLENCNAEMQEVNNEEHKKDVLET